MANGEPVEVEVKLGVTRPGLVRRLITDADPLRLAGFAAAGEPHLVTVVDRYVDTDPYEGRLALALMRARLRVAGRSVVLTVKRPGTEALGVTTRVELEAPATRSLDPRRWPESAARSALIAATAGESLVEIARLRQRRLTRLLHRAGTTVEVSLDALAALDGRRVVGRRHELEAELVTGDEAALADLAAALRGVDGIGPALGSKLRFTLDAVLVR
jgi:inorganic triphosphatase YgiF